MEITNSPENENRVADAIEMLCNAVNGGRGLESLVIKALLKQHRTLQASFWRLIFDSIEEYSKVTLFDLRNEGAIKSCKQITEFINEPDNQVYVPYI